MLFGIKIVVNHINQFSNYISVCNTIFVYACQYYYTAPTLFWFEIKTILIASNS